MCLHIVSTFKVGITSSQIFTGWWEEEGLLHGRPGRAAIQVNVFIFNGRQCKSEICKII